ncbi:unnamed protein product [Orchesella dallaii]|uniref:NACHT domain-containing protein n=1 Tax=Orchesella dallaii TaxID=48710 RepID=A0ABP1S2V0_9HEXA
MFNKIVYQGRELDKLYLTSHLGPEVVRVIEDCWMENIMEESSGEINLFSNILLPFIKSYEYVNRKIEFQGVISYRKDTCRQKFETHLESILQHRKSPVNIFAVSWNEDCKCAQGNCSDSFEKVSKILREGSGDLKLGKNIRIVALDDKDNPGIQFEKFNNFAKTYTTHWLHASDVGLVWEKAGNGSSAKLRQYLKTGFFKEDFFLSNLNKNGGQRVICIFGDAGMGKTTFLQATAIKIKANHPDRLVCFMTCEKFGEILQVLNSVHAVKSIDILVMVEVLVRGFQLTSEIEKKVLECLISYSDNNASPKIELLLDGFEDLNRLARKMLLKYLKKGPLRCFRVWLTVRTHLKYLIEDTVNLVAYELCSFTDTEIIYCFNRISEYCCSNQEFCQCKNRGRQLLAELLVSPHLESHLKINLVELLANPRNLKFLFKYMREHRLRNPFLLSAAKIMKIVLEGMIDVFLDKHCSLKRSSAEEKVPRILKKYVCLAVQYYKQKPLGNGELSDVQGNFDPELYAIGLIERDRESKVRFVHNAFPSYLLANYYANSMPSSIAFVEFFLYKMLYEDCCEEVRMFYDQKLGMDKLDPKILRAWGDVIQKYLITFHDLSDDSVKHEQPSVLGTVLHLTIIEKRLEIAKLLIKSLRSSPLECRRLISRKVIVEVEVNGCKKNSKDVTHDEDGSTTTSIEMSALSLAVMFGNPELVHGMYEVLETGENNVWTKDSFTKLDTYNFTPIHLAVISCNVENLLYLSSEHQLSINTLDLRKHLPIHLIFYNKWSFKLSILPPDSQNRHLVFRSINICKYYNDLDETMCWENVNLPDSAGHFPVLASKIKPRLTLSLMKKNLNFECKDAKGTLTHYRSANSYVKIMEKLAGRSIINFKNNVNSFAPLHRPLHLACSAGFLPMIKCMIEKRVEINIKNKNGLTTSYFAIYYGRVDILKYLLDNGMDRSVENLMVNEVPILHHVAVKGYLEMVKYLVTELRYPLNVTDGEEATVLHKVAYSGRLDSARLLIEMGVEVNAKDNQDQTPLHLACSTGTKAKLELVQFLIEKGGDLNMKTIHGKTPMHFAAEGGAGVNMEDVNGQTPLHVTTICHCSTDMVEFLIRAGGDMHLRDKYNNTPLCALRRHNN